MKKYNGFKKALLLTTAVTALSLPNIVRAYSDNFDDNDDTIPAPAWVQFDGIAALGGPAFPWTQAGGVYRYQAPASIAPGLVGPARGASFRTDINYTDFYVSVDVVGYDAANPQLFGLVARAESIGAISTPNATKGYVFGYANTENAAQGYSLLAIFRVRNELQTSGVSGTPNPSDPGVTELRTTGAALLDPFEKYRFVFMGKGTHLEGRVYKLPELSLIAALSSDTSLDLPDPQHTSGSVGILAVNLGAAVSFEGPVDVSFDNFLATNRVDTCEMGNEFADDFDDGNDAGWLHYNPFVGPCSFEPQPTWTFPGGNSYRIISPTPSGACGPTRAGSVRTDYDYTDFHVSVDLLDWDDTVRQLFGLIARVQTPGLQTTSGILFSYELGGGTLPNATGGDLDILMLAGEAPASGQIEMENSSLHLTKGKQYRFSLSGKGSDLLAQVFELPIDLNPAPIKTLHATDPFMGAPPYDHGYCGILVADQTSGALNLADATFDNYYSGPCAEEPRLTIAPDFGDVNISWTSKLRGLWILECSPVLGPGAWVEVPINTILLDPPYATKVHHVVAPAGNNFYRLRKL